MNKYLTEFSGTFFLVLTIGYTVIPARPANDPVGRLPQRIVRGEFIKTILTQYGNKMLFV